MSEIKFACPYCSQHVICDDIYCAERVVCPGCGNSLIVPPRAAFIPMQSGNLVLTLPIASKEPPPIPAVGLEPATGGGRTAGTLEGRRERFPVLLPFWVLLFLPFVLALVFARRPGGLVSIEFLFVLAAIAAGFYLAAVQKKSDLALVLRGILYAIGMLFVFVVVAVGLLFVGCLILLSSHQ